MAVTIGGALKGDFRLFSGRANPQLAKEIAAILGVELGKISLAPFPNGETRVQIEESIRGTDAYIIQPTCHPANDHLMELLLTMDAMKRASVRQITAVIPYFGYGRQDKKSTGREPISAKLIADLLTAAGAQRVVAVDLHVAQIQGFFDIPADHLTALTTLANHFKEKRIDNGVIVAPDAGRVKLAEKYANILGFPLALMHKRRSGAGGRKVETTSDVVGDVAGKTPIIVDDEIATGGTVLEQVTALQQAGANPAYISVTHPVLAGPASERLSHSAIREVVVTNTIPVPAEKQVNEKIKVLSIAPLLAEAILRIHQHRSVSEVFSAQKLIFPV